jgi:PIN domain nuclease of toxin-antitoxin system
MRESIGRVAILMNRCRMIFSVIPSLHGDPFDRMLVAQARIEQAKLVSKDRVFTGYPVELFW